MLSVFGFCFFRGSTSAIFRFFCRSTFVRFRFWKITLQSNFFQTCWLTIGDLGYRNLFVLQGKMLPFFFWDSSSGFRYLSLFKLEMVCLKTSVGVAPQQLTSLNSSATGGGFPLPCPMNS